MPRSREIRRTRRGAARPTALIRKIAALPPAKRSLVEAFVDFVGSRASDAALVAAAGALSADTFAAAWDNPDDAVYDAR